MAATPVDIVNNALILIGTERIEAMDDDNKRARLMNDIYDTKRKWLLASHPWNFALEQRELAASATAPEFKYTYQFPLPTDCLRVVGIDEPDDLETEWKVVGRNVYTDSTPLKIWQISDITDEGKFSLPFQEALAALLAKDTCYAFTQSASLQQRLQDHWLRVVREARAYDAQEGSVTELVATDFTLARR